MAGEQAGSPILEPVLTLTLTLSTGLPATYKLHVVITFIILHILPSKGTVLSIHKERIYAGHKL